MQSQKGPRQAESPAGKTPFTNGVAVRPDDLDGGRSSRDHPLRRLVVDIAHYLNNLLAVLVGSNDMLRARFGDLGDPEVTELELALTRATEVVQRMERLGQPQFVPHQPVDFNVLLKEVRPILTCLARGRVDLELVLAPSLPLVRGRIPGLEEAITNLVANARDACACQGNVTVETAEVWLTADLSHRHGVVPAGRWVVIRVIDTGCGMEEATQARLFEPFFTTKPAGKGTGVGLAIVRDAIREHHGHVVVRSTPRCGSTFEVYLPPLAS
jgi:two-component system cell cycle sensor histidine kinase/response regulator CckA